MKFPEFDELGNMIGQGFDSGAQVLNNPGVQGLLAAGLGAASQVGKRNTGPLNTLGAAGLAGLGAYGLGRNVNSRNKYNLARIKQLQEGQDQEAAKLQLAATEKQGLKDYLGERRAFATEGMGMNNLRGQVSDIRMKLPNMPNEVPYAPAQGPEYKGAQEQMRGIQSKVDDYDQRNLLSQMDNRNPVLNKLLEGNQGAGGGTDGLPVKSIQEDKYAQELLRLDPSGNRYNEFQEQLKNAKLMNIGDKYLVLDKSGKPKASYDINLKPDQEIPYIEKVAIAKTSAVERTKNAEEIYNEYGLKGGGEIVAGNIKRLDSAMEVLKRTPNFTGPKFELMSDSAIKLFYPDVWEAKQAVELVIQPTLKETLGAQMSEQEGVRVFDRSTALALPPEANYRKWSLLAKQVKAVHEAKMSVVRYIQKNGSMEGFIGKLPSEFEYTDKALGWDKLPGYEKAVGEMEIVIRGGANSNKGKRKPFLDKSKEERFQEFKRLNQ